MTERPAGAVLDPLGVTLDLDDDQQVVEAVVLAKVVSFGEQSSTALVIASSEGLDWIAQGGLIGAAKTVMDMPERDDD